MIKRYILAVCIALLALALFGCSCAKEEEHNHSTPTSQAGTGDRPDNNNPPAPPLVDKECTHYWTNVKMEYKETETSSVTVKGECYECRKALSREVVTVVTYEEWIKALSSESFGSFTVCNGKTYTDYAPNGSKRWKIVNDIYTEEYFMGVEEKTSSEYAENFEGFSMSYGNFKYNQETRTYVQKINEQSSVELGFADGKLLFHATNNIKGDHVQRTESYYVNYDNVKVELPSYFFTQYEALTSREELEKTAIGEAGAAKVLEILSGVSFDSGCEVSFLENGRLGVYFYLDEARVDPLFGGTYTSVSIVANNGKLLTLTVGNNTLDFTY